MAVFTFPSDIYPYEDILTPMGATSTFVARSGGTQTQTRPGSHWTYKLQFRNMSDDQWRRLRALIVRLNGQQHRLRTPIWSRLPIAGDITDGAATQGGQINHLGSTEAERIASVTGTKIETNEWGNPPANATHLLRAGDRIEIQYASRYPTADRVTGDSNIESRLHEVTVDSTWTANGRAQLEIWPPVTVTPTDNAKVVVINPHETWIMTNAPQFSASSSLTRRVSLELATDLLTGQPVS